LSLHWYELSTVRRDSDCEDATPNLGLRQQIWWSSDDWFIALILYNRIILMSFMYMMVTNWHNPYFFGMFLVGIKPNLYNMLKWQHWNTGYVRLLSCMQMTQSVLNVKFLCKWNIYLHWRTLLHVYML
jgi:hypothetical protein